MRSVELFAGCGGLALGLAEAGFVYELVVEFDAHAHATLQDNKLAGICHVADWPLLHADVRSIDYATLEGSFDLVSGGPPCQPFSIGGKHLGPDDHRNMWPEAIRAVSALEPRTFMFENVRGLLRPAFEPYLNYLRLAFGNPEIAIRPSQSWQEHSRRLRKHAKARGHSTYDVAFYSINTADYGAPQKRHRTVLVGVRYDIAARWKFPGPTHSLEALAWSQFVDGEYWARHYLDPEYCINVCAADDQLLDKLQKGDVKPTTSPWRTVRDAIGDLPIPTLEEEVPPGHRLHRGARVYPGHTGSRWDEPAKSLKAGDHGVPGGENMLAFSDGSVRYFTLREMARLQDLPDKFRLPSGWKAPVKQLGNAVPVQVGKILGTALAEAINSSAPAGDNGEQRYVARHPISSEVIRSAA